MIEPTPDYSRLVEKIRAELRNLHYSYQTERTYINWIRRFLAFHNIQADGGATTQEISAFLLHLTTEEKLSVSTQNQALNAIKFLYKHILKIDIGELKSIKIARNPERNIRTLSADQVDLIISVLNGVSKLMAILVYGAGVRVSEVLRLRINCIDFDRRRITIRDNKGCKYRFVPLPSRANDALRAQIEFVKKVHEEDLKDGFGSVYFPRSLERKYPDMDTTFDWQYLFPSSSLVMDPRKGIVRRHHISEHAFYHPVRQAASKTAITTNIRSSTLRHSFATHMLSAGSDIYTLKEILGHNNSKTTQFYRHALSSSSSANFQSDWLPTPKHCERLAWLNRLLRSGLEIEEIEARRWSRGDGNYSIYCLAENGKRVRYIGITNQAPIVRLRQHIADSGRGNNLYKENWIRLCIKRDIPITIHVVRSGLTAERAGMMEFELIRFFKKTFSLVNTHAGGFTGYAGLSEESKEKHRINTQKGLMVSDQKAQEEEDQ